LLVANAAVALPPPGRSPQLSPMHPWEESVLLTDFELLADPLDEPLLKVSEAGAPSS